MSGSAQQDAQRRRESYEAARREVAPYVGDISTQPNLSAERIYRLALIKLHVNIADLTLDNSDAGTAFRDRFRQWRDKLRNGASAQDAALAFDAEQDAAVKAGVKQLSDWHDSYNLIAQMTGDAPSVPEDGPPPSVADMYRESLQRMNVPGAADEPDEVMAHLWQAAMRAGGAQYGALARQVAGQTSQMGADSAAIASFESRFPNITRAHRIF